MSRYQEAPAELVELVVPLERDPGEEGPDAEWIWAEPLGADRYRVEGAPFFAYGLSCGDVVRAEERRPGEAPEVAGVESKSGARTVRLALADPWRLDAPEAMAFLDGLADLGCRCQGLPPALVAVSIPLEVDMAPVVERLLRPCRDGLLLWEWADPRPI